MKLTIYTSPWAPLRDEAWAFAKDTYDCEILDVAACPYPHRTIPCLAVEREGLPVLVLDCETPEDVTMERVERAVVEADSAPVPVAQPTDIEVRLAALEAKLGAPTPKELTAAREAIVARKAKA